MPVVLLDVIPGADATKEDKVASREVRAKKYGIEIKEGGHLSAGPNDPSDESLYGDPVNASYPLAYKNGTKPDKARSNNARARFAQNYTSYKETASRRVILTRIVKAQIAAGSNPSYDPSSPLDKLLPPELASKMSADSFIPGSGIILTDVFPVEIVEDVAASEGSRRKVRVRSTGSIANKVYQSGRIIPDSVQREGLQRSADRGIQMTSFLRHPAPYNDVRGDLEELAAVVVGQPVMDGDKTEVTFEVLDRMPQGQLLLALLDCPLRLGVSQRALGREERVEVERPYPTVSSEPSSDAFVPGEPSIEQLSVVREIYGIYGYDFCQLDAANAGPETEVRRVSDSVLASARSIDLPDAAEIGEKIDSGNQSNTEIAMPGKVEDGKVNIEDSEVVKALVDSNAKLQAGLAAVLDKLAAKEAAEAKEIADKAAADAIAVAAAKAADEAKAIADKAAADAKLADEAKAIADKAAADAKLADEAKLALLDTEIESAAGDLSGAEKAAVRTSLQDKVISLNDNNAVKESVRQAIELVNAGRAKERLAAMGFQPRQSESEMPVTDGRIEGVGKDYLHGVAFLSDKLAETGEMTSSVIDPAREKTREGKTLHPQIKKVFDQFDKLYAGSLRREQDKLRQAGGGSLNDASLHADFETPYTVSRIVLGELYADEIALGVTQFGVMSADRDTVPVTIWRRGATGGGGENTYRPSVGARYNIKVGELQAIPEGGLHTDWVNVDAVARKLRTSLSDEFVTRSSRRADITGVAKALNNLVLDTRRCIEQDIFYSQLLGALLNDKVAFSASGTSDNSSAYQITIAADTTPVISSTLAPGSAATIVPNSANSALAVTVDGHAVYEYGTSSTTSDGYFYVVDHAAGSILFVDVNGAANTVTGAVTITVAGYQAGGLNTTRFDLTNSGDFSDERYLNGLLFAIDNLKAAMGQNTGYRPDILIQDEVGATLLQHAKAYESSGTRRAFRGDGPVVAGNFGSTAGLQHFASPVFPTNFALVGQREGCLFQTYAPMTLKGPFPTRDADGQLTGGSEYYTYQEDSISVPISAKLSLITLYRS